MADPIPKPTVDTKAPVAAPTTPATQAAKPTPTQAGANGLPTNLRPELSVVSVKNPNGNWVPSGIQVMKWDEKTQSYPWQTKNTETRLGYRNVRQAGFKDGQWGVDTRTGYVVPWTNRGTTTDANGKQVDAQWNDDMSIMSPEQFSRYSMYSAQDSNAPNYQQYHPLRDIHNANPYIRETARNFARTGEYTPYDMTKVYDRDAYYRGDAAAAADFDRLSEELGYGQYNSSPYSRDRYQDPLYRQMFFDRNKRQMYQMASANAQRWKAMTGLSYSTDQAHPRDENHFNTTYESDMKRIRNLIPNYDSLPQEQKLSQLRDLYSKISTGEIPNNYTLGPRISMLFYGMTKGNTITGDSINHQVPYKDWSLGNKLFGSAPVYLPKYTADIYKPTDPVQLATARHFGLIGSEGQVLENSDVAENFINQNKWFWDPEAYEQHVAQQREKGKSQADADVDNFFLYKSPGFYTQSQTAAASGRSSAIPAWLRSNPLVTNVDTSYIDGVHRSGQDVYNYNERTLGGASHIAGSAMRGGINFFTLGQGNDFADWAFKKLGDGSSMEENFARAVQHGANPDTLATAGLVAEQYPLILSMGVTAPASGAASLPQLGAQANTLRQQLSGITSASKLYQYIYGINNGQSYIRLTQAFNNLNSSAQRQMAYTMPLGSAQQKATIIEANGQNASAPLIALTGGRQFGAFSKALALNAGQFAHRTYGKYEAEQAGDHETATELAKRNWADLANMPVDMLLGKTMGAEKLPRWLRFSLTPASMTASAVAPFATYEVVDQAYKTPLNPHESFLERYIPESWQAHAANLTNNKDWAQRLALKQTYRSVADRSKTEGYSDPSSSNYWGRDWFGSSDAERDAIMASGTTFKKQDGSAYDPKNPEDVVDYTTRALAAQAYLGELPADFLQSEQFRSLPTANKLQVFKRFFESQMYVKADMSKHKGFIDTLTQAVENDKLPDLDALFVGDLKDDPTFDSVRPFVTSIAESIPLEEGLDMAIEATGADAQSGNTYLKGIVQQRLQSQLNFNTLSERPELLPKVQTLLQQNPQAMDALINSPEVQNLDLASLVTGSQGTQQKVPQQLVDFFGNIISSNTQARELMQTKVGALSNQQFVQMLQQHQAQQGDASGSGIKLPAVFKQMAQDEVVKRLQSGTPEGAELGYLLTPYVQQQLESSDHGLNVDASTAKAFMHVMKQPAYWEQFDPQTRLRFVEFLQSRQGSQSFAGLSQEEQAAWTSEIEKTIEPFLQQHMRDALTGKVPFDDMRRVIALRYKFAKDPMMFYGAAAATILGGVTLLGSLFTSGDDDDDDDEEADDIEADDDAAYRKRMRKRLQQQQAFELGLGDDEED